MAVNFTYLKLEIIICDIWQKGMVFHKNIVSFGLCSTIKMMVTQGLIVETSPPDDSHHFIAPIKMHSKKIPSCCHTRHWSSRRTCLCVREDMHRCDLTQVYHSSKSIIEKVLIMQLEKHNKIFIVYYECVS